MTGRINAKQKDVDRVQARLDTLSLYYSKLVKSAYKNRDSKVWYMYILASENVGQAFRRAGYLRNLSAEMNRQGEKIIDTKSELQREMDSLSVLKRDAEVIRMITAIFFRISNIPGKSTSPFSIIRSSASPVRIGRYKVSATTTAANIRESTR